MRCFHRFYGALSRRPQLINLLHALHLIKPHTGTIESELAVLERHAEGRQKALEIGTYQGVSAVRIARALAPGGRLYCIDPWSELNGMLGPCWSIAMRHFKRSQIEAHFVILRDYSVNVQALLPVDFDFVFIDGDHTWEGIETDWRIVAPRIQQNGILCLHDAVTPASESWRVMGSTRFFAEVIAHDPAFEVIETVHSLVVLRKK